MGQNKGKLKAGDKFGRWQLVSPLGKGGNGIVWKVKSNEGDCGAIKLLNSRHHFNEKRCLRFKNEVEAMMQCHDIQGILPLIDSNLSNISDNNEQLWFVSAIATPLEEALGNDFILNDVIEACASFARTLADMHERGFSHRDIKPDNLFKYQNTWVIGDFGLIDFPGKKPITSEGERVGPLFYMPHEMLESATESDGKKADVYSLAKTLWKLATGHNYPLQGEQSAEVSGLTLSAYITDNSNVRQLDFVIASATKHQSEQRISMADFYRELKAWLTPVPDFTDNVLDLSYLQNKVDSLGADKYKRKVKHEHEMYLKLQKEIKRVINSFDPCLNSLKEAMENIDISVEEPKDLRGGHKKIWKGILDTQYRGKNYEVWVQEYSSLLLCPIPNIMFLNFGVGIGIEDPDKKFRILYESNKPAIIVAGYVLGDEKVWGESDSFLFGQPSEKQAVEKLINGLKLNLKFAVENFLEKRSVPVRYNLKMPYLK